MHGATARAIDMWRQAIRLSGESRLYGDAAACRRALTPPFSSSLPPRSPS
jgi:hypothetical protein